MDVVQRNLRMEILDKRPTAAAGDDDTTDVTPTALIMIALSK